MNKFLNKKITRISLAIFVLLFLVFVVITGGSPNYLFIKVTTASFLISFSLINLTRLSLWGKIILSLLTLPLSVMFVWALLWIPLGLYLSGGGELNYLMM